MEPLTRADLMSLETYTEARTEFRRKIIEHKKNRTVALGDNATLYFEDRLTIQYQIQEMLRAEKVFEVDGINEELDAYNPLIPSGHNWKAAMMIEYTDVEIRRARLAELIGIDRLTWVQVGEVDKVFAISNEDIKRETGDKTSAVHFLRFELEDDSVSTALDGAPISLGCDHENYLQVVTLPEPVRKALISDLS